MKTKRLLYNVQAKKDPEAFAALYDMYVEKLYRFIYFKVGNREEAEDLTSEVFLKAWHYMTDSPDTVASFSGLIYQIARNLVIDHYRGKAKKQEMPIDQLRLPSESLEIEQVHSAVDSEHILRVLKELKHEYQEIILLRYTDEYSVSEIAEILGKKKTAVRVSLHRAMKVLKETVKEREERT